MRASKVRLRVDAQGTLGNATGEHVERRHVVGIVVLTRCNRLIWPIDRSVVPPIAERVLLAGRWRRAPPRKTSARSSEAALTAIETVFENVLRETIPSVQEEMAPHLADVILRRTGENRRPPASDRLRN